MVLLTVLPELRDKLVCGLVEQSGHIIVQGVHVLHQPLVCLVVHLEGCKWYGSPPPPTRNPRPTHLHLKTDHHLTHTSTTSTPPPQHTFTLNTPPPPTYLHLNIKICLQHTPNSNTPPPSAHLHLQDIATSNTPPPSTHLHSQHTSTSSTPPSHFSSTSNTASPSMCFI